MLEDIDKNDCVECLVGKRNCGSVEPRHGNLCVFANEHINSANLNIRAVLHDQRRQQTVATSNIQNVRVPWDKLRDTFSEDVYSPTVNVPTVEFSDDAHLRRIPRMLMKKPERMV